MIWIGKLSGVVLVFDVYEAYMIQNKSAHDISGKNSETLKRRRMFDFEFLLENVDYESLF